MCGILAMIGSRDPQEMRALASRMSHRGPDEQDMYVSPQGNVLCHERLSIIDVNTGKQPIQGSNSAYVIHNGEIYNHELLKDEHLREYQFRTTCDSEVIVHLFEKYGTDFCHLLDGVFAFTVLDGHKWMVARDPIGVKPLYYGKDKDDNLYFSSEMKSLVDQVIDVKAFPPGHYMSSEEGLVKFYNPDWQDASFGDVPVNYDLLREKLINATKKRLMSDVPLGVLLSGGLDSSLIASVVSRLMKESGQELHSFSVGLTPNAPDLVAAREVAKFIGSTHHEIYFTVEEGIKALSNVIYHLETYDVTTVRAATPMYFLSKAITDMGIKVVLSGEGADEIFGGYLYFHNAPSPLDFQKETISRVLRLSTADCLRADKSTMAHGLEARVPFLDKGFLATVIPFKPEDKQPSRAIGKPEKYILRKAFESEKDPYLPESILWRQKEQFGDGVGYSWIDSVREFGEQMVSDAEMAAAADLFPHNTPDTKEAFLFRKLFHENFPQDTAARTVLKWVPKWQSSTDPSGRVCDNHIEKTEKLVKV